MTSTSSCVTSRLPLLLLTAQQRLPLGHGILTHRHLQSSALSNSQQQQPRTDALKQQTDSPTRMANRHIHGCHSSTTALYTEG